VAQPTVKSRNANYDSLGITQFSLPPMLKTTNVMMPLSKYKDIDTSNKQKLNVISSKKEISKITDLISRNEKLTKI